MYRMRAITSGKSRARTVQDLSLIHICSADIDDVIMNTVGGMIGFGIYAGMNRLFRQKNWWRKAVEK